MVSMSDSVVAPARGLSIFFPQERFRIPIVDPLLIVCAGACVAKLRGRPEASHPL